MPKKMRESEKVFFRVSHVKNVRSNDESYSELPKNLVCCWWQSKLYFSMLLVIVQTMFLPVWIIVLSLLLLVFW